MNLVELGLVNEKPWRLLVRMYALRTFKINDVSDIYTDKSCRVILNNLSQNGILHCRHGSYDYVYELSSHGIWFAESMLDINKRLVANEKR